MQKFTVMLDELQEYSSDLEWLLQNKQAKDNQILQLMVPEHFERTLRLAYLITMHPQAARKATCETLANALLSRHRYSSDQEVQEWLDQILVITCQEYLQAGDHSADGTRKDGEDLFGPGWKPTRELDTWVWRALESLPFSDRLLYLLCTVFNFPLPKVARLLGLRDGVAGARLELSRLQLLKELNGDESANLPLDVEKINSCLTRTFQDRYQTECMLPEGMEGQVAEIQALVEQKRRERRRRARIQEILLVAIVIVLVITLVQAAVSLSADPNAVQVTPAIQSCLASTGI